MRVTMRSLTHWLGALIFSLTCLSFSGSGNVAGANECNVEKLFFSYFFPYGQDIILKPNSNKYRIALLAEPDQKSDVEKFYQYFSNIGEINIEYTTKSPNIVIIFTNQPFRSLFGYYENFLENLFENERTFVLYIRKIIDENLNYFTFFNQTPKKDKTILILFLSKNDFSNRAHNGISDLLFASLFNNAFDQPSSVSQIHDIFTSSHGTVPLEKCDEAVARLFLSEELTFGMDRQTVSNLINRPE